MLDARDRSGLPQELFSLLQEVVEYRDVSDWSVAVRVCEALAISGWGSKERVDARSRFDGDCWETFFITGKGDRRYRLGRWHKRKTGWVMFNPQYYFSPDRPEVPAQDWKKFAGVEFPVVDAVELPSQRNYQKQMPIVMGGFGGSNEASKHVFRLVRQLTGILHEKMHPTVYGDALENLYLTLHAPGSGSRLPVGLKVGSYNAGRRSFQCTLAFPERFHELSVTAQKRFFTDALNSAVEELEKKLLKKHLSYDFDAVRLDLAAAFRVWAQAPPPEAGL